MSRDLRAELEAVAAGKATTPPSGAVLDPASLAAEQQAYQAWSALARAAEHGRLDQSGHGEALTAPAELLPPLA